MIISKEDMVDYHKYQNPTSKLSDFDIRVFKDSMKKIYNTDNEVVIEYCDHSYKDDTIPLKKFLIFLRKYKLHKIL